MKKTPKRLRTERELRQYEVAKKLGICPSVYCLKENGKRKWSLKDALKLSKFYNIKIEDLKL